MIRSLHSQIDFVSMVSFPASDMVQARLKRVIRIDLNWLVITTVELCNVVAGCIANGHSV